MWICHSQHSPQWRVSCASSWDQPKVRNSPWCWVSLVPLGKGKSLQSLSSRLFHSGCINSCHTATRIGPCSKHPSLGVLWLNKIQVIHCSPTSLWSFCSASAKRVAAMERACHCPGTGDILRQAHSRSPHDTAGGYPHVGLRCRSAVVGKGKALSHSGWILLVVALAQLLEQFPRSCGSSPEVPPRRRTWMAFSLSLSRSTSGLLLR